MNNTACIITELIAKNEVVVDGKEMLDKIINEQTIDTLFSQLQTYVIQNTTDDLYNTLKEAALVANVGLTLHSIVGYYNPGIRRHDPYSSAPIIAEENENDPILGVLVKHISTIANLLDLDKVSIAHDLF